jgi:hypothetical protein
MSTSCHRVARLVLASALMVSLDAAAVQTASSDMIQAIWKVQRISFNYRGASHTCSGLSERLRSILRYVGVHETVTISLQGCHGQGGTQVAHILLASPVEATEENLSEVTSHDSRAELIARLRGVGLASADDIARFPAAWRTISFANALPLRLTAADCDLLRELRREVFPKLAIRVINDEMNCPLGGSSVSRPQLTVAALVAISPAGESPIRFIN